ncbi:DUF6894 family protein [Microvirga roseola]|uniref:DUF6894 family protein n=1 Tax=Microvirga roseola TaxID=2883126 RepID=UPI001E5300C9|nr:hypothetical protein [Microvirga roseola]
MRNDPKKPSPKKPSQRQDLKRWDDEGGAPRSGHPSREPPFAPERGTGTTLYYFNIQTGSGLVEDPEGETYPDLQTARKAALAQAGDMIAEGDQKGEDRRSWRVEIMDRANQPVLTVMFSEALQPKTDHQAEWPRGHRAAE